MLRHFTCVDNMDTVSIPSNKTWEFCHTLDMRTPGQLALLRSTATSLLGSRDLEGLLSPRITSELHFSGPEFGLGL